MQLVANARHLQPADDLAVGGALRVRVNGRQVVRLDAGADRGRLCKGLLARSSSPPPATHSPARCNAIAVLSRRASFLRVAGCARRSPLAQPAAGVIRRLFKITRSHVRSKGVGRRAHQFCYGEKFVAVARQVVIRLEARGVEVQDPPTAVLRAERRRDLGGRNSATKLTAAVTEPSLNAELGCIKVVDTFRGAYPHCPPRTGAGAWMTGVPSPKAESLIPAGWFDAWADHCERPDGAR
jgi:hypothetical protein